MINILDSGNPRIYYLRCHAAETYRRVCFFFSRIFLHLFSAILYALPNGDVEGIAEKDRFQIVVLFYHFNCHSHNVLYLEFGYPINTVGNTFPPTQDAKGKDPLLARATGYRLAQDTLLMGFHGWDRRPGARNL